MGLLYCRYISVFGIIFFPKQNFGLEYGVECGLHSKNIVGVTSGLHSINCNGLECGLHSVSSGVRNALKIGEVSQLNTNFCFTFSSACFLHWNGTNYKGNSQASPFVTHIPLPCSQPLLMPIARLPLRIKRATSSSLIRCRSQEVMDVIRPSVAEPVGWTPRSSGYFLAVRGEGVRNRLWRGWSESCIVT